MGEGQADEGIQRRGPAIDSLGMGGVQRRVAAAGGPPVLRSAMCAAGAKRRRRIISCIIACATATLVALRAADV